MKRLIICTLFIIFSSTKVWALIASNPVPTKPEEEPHKSVEEIMKTTIDQPEKSVPIPDVAEMIYPDQMGKELSQMVVGLANRLDSFFGDNRADDQKNGSILRVSPGYTLYNGDKPGVAEFGINLNLKLLNLESKAKKLEKTIRDKLIESTVGKENAPGTNSNSKNTPAEAEKESWYYNLESKLLVKPAIYYSGKIRVRRDFDKNEFLIHHFALSAGWDTDSKWSQLTSLYSDHALATDLLFRLVNEVNWYITNVDFQTNHGPSLMQTINKYNSIAYNFRLIFGIVDGHYQRLDTPLSIDFRHSTPSKKIFIDLIPGLNYPASNSYNEIQSLQIKFEYLFGDVD